MMATAAPLVAQIVMLAVLLVMRRWLFALMLLPSLVGCLAMLLVQVVRTRHRQPDAACAPDGARGPIDDATRFDLLDAVKLEELLSLSARHDPLAWRAVARGWLAAPSMDVPVGMGRSGVFHIDLAGQGPHALVAGTTGSGKSVLLQSWCLALACRNKPDDLHFVFLDFKGGASFRPLERLPHCVGAVCDLDLEHAVRALNAIEAELKRRERLMAERHAQDVSDLADAPPRLVVIVDEFHALRDQLPDMMDRLVRIASLGRALGMHVIACTQHPAGQVSADMKANMTLGLCMRVRDGMQSVELLGSTKAARIPPSLPGVAYRNDGASVEAWRCAAAGDLGGLVDAVVLAARFHGCVPPPELFTAPLPRRLDRLPRVPSGEGVPFALRDDGVSLSVAFLPLDRGNVGLIGAHGRGKTNLLVQVARHLSRRRAADGAPDEPSSRDVAVRFTRRDVRGYRTRTLRPASAPPTVPQDVPRDVSQGAHQVWIIDDAGPLFDPFCDDPMRLRLDRALNDHTVTVVFAVETGRHVRIPEHCAIRVVFPTGDRAADQMNGVPGGLCAAGDRDDPTTPGRAVLIDHARAHRVQCVWAGDDGLGDGWHDDDADGDETCGGRRA